jgi:starvation-inducible DNA-binding protein
MVAAPKVDLGLSANARKKVADALGDVLADHFVLALKTQNFHWNVTGPNFSGLHAMFGTQYEAMRDSADDIAERIRALGYPSPGGYAVYTQATNVKDAKGGESWQEMCAVLAADNDALVKRCREVKDAAEEAGDAETGDLMIERMGEMAKAAWMLRSQVG